ncbi:phage portal protein, lambda family [Escherichia coli 3-020-07_S4_C2]|nr:phage portal protein, lambda family [Escherichia coli 3-020-07_S4_C2]KDZ46320.1 phage portal protein, lambda family [Escherichia coli 3-020-07_S4_C3]
MNCLASREYDAVIFVGPARTGKTIGLIDGWIVYTIVCDPSDMLVVQMTEDKAREHSKKRLDRTFRSSAAVKKRMSPRRNDNNVHDKTFRDGSFLKIGWPSVNIMSSSDYRFVALTDYDRFPENIDSEGDGFSLASKRTTTFMSAAMTLVESSPGRDICDSKWRRKSPHEAPPTTGILSLYNRGDRRRWYWPCPHCGEYFQPAMDAMTGYRNEPDPFKASEAAYLLCPHCSGIITAEKKRELNSAGVWLREGQVIDRNGNVSGEPRRSRNGSKDKERELTIQPGIIYDDLKPGEEIGMVKSDRPNPNLETFRNGQLRAVAAGSRLSFSSTARNYNGTYSAQRQELVESTDGYLILQDWFIGAVTRPMYRAWLKQAVASGVIRLPRDLDLSSLYTAVYSGPVMPWIDPVKEAEAWKIQIRGGAATESDWVRAGGRNPDDVKRRRKAEIDENRKLDLVFDTDPASDKGGSSAATKRQEPQHTDDQSEE